ncbi:MBL fold metallo-hydrolase [Herbiconiux sp. CPCC 205763]|uniref:MBL fold metallo-hydrolase n=1 Tax=Herbiconiux aconitum TaxID=2970913 RepID=A0ABT2GMQ1_9MICO|nr:MBL fold metallo-hydrolase [Herbiconiux aconitum]MCS5717468.1 MBL fold metallo-hydrolase [Herbiconiux aconitum]
MRLTVLGTSTPYPRPGNACSGYLLQSDAAPGERPTSVWIDAGTGTLAELQRHLPPADLDAIWISHRHADHTADLLVAYYALRFAERRAEHPIPLIGPEGLLERMAGFLGPNSVDELPRVFEVQEMSGWGEREVGGLRLEWGPVQHGVPAFGLAVSDGSTRFAYSGDSAPCTSLEELAEGAGTLLVEAGYDEAPPRGDAPAHHTPEDAGRTASAAQVSRLLLTHIAETVTMAAAVTRASTHFSGETVAVAPGDVLAV